MALGACRNIMTTQKQNYGLIIINPNLTLEILLKIVLFYHITVESDNFHCMVNRLDKSYGITSITNRCRKCKEITKRSAIHPTHI